MRRLLEKLGWFHVGSYQRDGLYYVRLDGPNHKHALCSGTNYHDAMNSAWEEAAKLDAQ